MTYTRTQFTKKKKIVQIHTQYMKQKYTTLTLQENH